MIRPHQPAAPGAPRRVLAVALPGRLSLSAQRAVVPARVRLTVRPEPFPPVRYSGKPYTRFLTRLAPMPRVSSKRASTLPATGRQASKQTFMVLTIIGSNFYLRGCMAFLDLYLENRIVQVFKKREGESPCFGIT